MMELVASNVTMVAHIRRDGWTMYCGQKFSNLSQSQEELGKKGYRVCATCQKKAGVEVSMN